MRSSMKKSRFIFLLSGEAVETAAQEVKSLFEIAGGSCRIVIQNGFILVAESDLRPETVKLLCGRSAEIRLACELKAKIESSSLKTISNIDFSFVQSPFCVRVKDFRSEKESTESAEERLASVVWMALQDLGRTPAVDLSHPRTTIYFILAGEHVYVSNFIWKQAKGEFVGRAPSEKPRFHPTSLVPKLARLIVNLSRAKTGELLLDPFCGVGSILIEGLIAGANVFGVDFDKTKPKDADANINAYRRLYKHKNYKLKTWDATKLEKLFKPNSIDAIATDPPYGRSSVVSAKNINELYEKFLKSTHKVLKKEKYLAMIRPDNLKLKIDSKKWKKVHESELYVHASLTRKILVLQKR